MRALLLAFLLVPSVLAGCLGDDAETPPVARPDGEVVLNFAPGLAWFNVTLSEPRTNLTLTLLRDLSVVDRVPLTRLGNFTHSIGYASPFRAGAYTAQVHDAGLLVAERSFSLAAPAWAPRGDTVSSFRAERIAPDATAKIVGTLRGAASGWRLDASGWIEGSSPNGSYAGRALRVTVEPDAGHPHVVAADLDLRLASPGGAPLGAWRLERERLALGYAPDRTGAPHEAALLRTWSRMNGTLRAEGRDVPVDTVQLTHQWVTRAGGVPLGYERLLWDNATGRTSRVNESGGADDFPRILTLATGPMPQPLRAGDGFALVTRDGATLRFTVAADGDRIVARASGPDGTAKLTLDAAGRLIGYEEASVRGGARTTVYVEPPKGR